MVVQYLRNDDEEHDTARVYGLVRNTGEKRTPQADIVVTLRGRSGSLKGQDRTELGPLAGGEEREFSLEFTSHGKTSRVDIAIVPRGSAVGEDEEDDADIGDVAGDASGDGDDDG